MSQHDFDIANQLMPVGRSDINAALQALASLNEGATEPATKYASQVWVDTTANILKLRNTANTAWISIADLDYTNDRVEFVANIYHAASTSGYTFKSSGGATLLTLSNTGVLALGGKLDTNANIIQESIGTAKVSASTVTPPTNGNIFHITGTTTVAGFTNGSAGQRYTVIPDGVFTLTNSSTLIIEGGADYTTVVGTSFEIIQDTATVWRVKVPSAGGFPAPDYQPADQTLTYLSKTTLAHGLGVVPSRTELQLVCVTANAPYAVGDIIPHGIGYQVGGSGYGIVAASDATNVIIRVGTVIQSLLDTGAVMNLAAANWKIRLKAWI